MQKKRPTQTDADDGTDDGGDEDKDDTAADDASAGFNRGGLLRGRFVLHGSLRRLRVRGLTKERRFVRAVAKRRCPKNDRR
jgi:hypothetical protein